MPPTTTTTTTTTTPTNTDRQQPQTKTLPATAMPLISPRALLAAHLAQPTPTRPSQRSPSTPQRIDLNTSSLTHTHGSSVVKIGATTIVCGIRAEILPVSSIANHDPKPQSLSSSSSSSSPPTDPIATYHLLVPNLELSTGCSPFHGANTPPTSQAQSLTQRLYTLLLTSRVVPAAELAITHRPDTDLTIPIQTQIERDSDILPDRGTQGEEIKAYWVLYIDLVCLSYGGGSSVFDASWLAVLAALKDTVLPAAQWNVDLGCVICDERRENGRKLSVRGMPVAMGFAVFVGDHSTSEKRVQEEQSWILVDPDAFEEQCCAESGCVVVDLSSDREGGKIVRVEKSGGSVVGVEELKTILGYAESRWSDWETVLERVRSSKEG